ncbi:ATP-grasp fold amidoligase family protein, partial [Curtobacterium sp. C2H10]
MVYHRDEFFTLIADKIAVRDYIKLTMGEEYLIPLLGVFNKPEDIDFDRLPEAFVMKCNHDSGSAIVCDDKKTLNRKYINQHFHQRLKRNPYYT